MQWSATVFFVVTDALTLVRTTSSASQITRKNKNCSRTPRGETGESTTTQGEEDMSSTAEKRKGESSTTHKSAFQRFCVCFCVFIVFCRRAGRGRGGGGHFPFSEGVYVLRKVVEHRAVQCIILCSPRQRIPSDLSHKASRTCSGWKKTEVELAIVEELVQNDEDVASTTPGLKSRDHVIDCREPTIHECWLTRTLAEVATAVGEAVRQRWPMQTHEQMNVRVWENLLCSRDSGRPQGF